MWLQLLLAYVITPFALGYTQCHPSNGIPPPVDETTRSFSMAAAERIDCHPDPNANSERCAARGCQFDSSVGTDGTPWCFYPPDYGYRMVEAPAQTHDGYIIHLTRTTNATMFGGDSQEIWVQVYMQNDHRLRIAVTDRKPRFQVPITIPSAGQLPSHPLYDVTFTATPTFGIRVVRRSSGELVLDTSLPGLLFSDQFIQMAIRLPEGSHLYGWGENEQHTFAHDMNWKTWGIYARDQPPDGSSNMYGVHPRLTVLDRNGDAVGLLFLNSAAQELAVTPLPGMIYRTIGGILDLYIFLGPSPENVVEQYTEAIGRFPIPPYWSLGFHLCRYGYNSLENMQAARNRMVEYKIPQDAQWGDIDIMERSLDFTVDKVRFGGLPAYVNELKKEGVRFVTILDPCISTGEPNCTYKPYDLGEQFGVWIRKPSGEPVLGQVWPEDPVYFPDYTNPRTHEWWRQLIVEFQQLIAYDGLWIDMNEPANFVAGDMNDGCAGTSENFPPYIPHIITGANSAADKTLCGDAVHTLGSHYFVHSLCGWSQSQPTLAGVTEATGKRGLVLSRSTYVGSGQWVAHWLGDNFSNWLNLRYSIIGMLQFNQFGIPLVGADICGFIGDTEEELCTRWQQLGAFYPFSRNHNAIGTIEQDPGVFGDLTARIARESLNIRYSLLPFLYTLFYKHYTQGVTVVRALWHEFPRDNATWTIDDQFMWGSALVISPALEKGQTTRTLYLPSEARWFDVTNFLNSTSWTEAASGWSLVPAPLDVIPLHVRGGVALPIQLPGLTTAESRKNPFELVFALDYENEARGQLYYDDGESLDTLAAAAYFLGEFGLVGNRIQMTVVKDGLDQIQFLHIHRIIVIGLSYAVENVWVNGELHADYNSSEGRLHINNLSLSVNDDWLILLSA